MPKRIGIVGGGALGTFLGSRLSSAGITVAMLVRSDARRDAIRRDHPAISAGLDPDILQDSGLVFVCVKAYDTDDAARALASIRLRDAAVCSLQNGWGHMEILAAALPNLPMLAASTSLGAYVDEQGSIRATDRGEIVLAPWRPADREWAERAERLLRDARFAASTRPDARPVLFRKLVLNSAVNPVTALARCTNGDLLREHALLRIAESAVGEGARVGRKLNLLEPSFDPPGALRSILQETAENRSSMLEDLTRGRRTEIEEITGAIVRLAGETRERTPVQQALLTLVRAAENRHAP